MMIKSLKGNCVKTDENKTCTHTRAHEHIPWRKEDWNQILFSANTNSLIMNLLCDNMLKRHGSVERKKTSSGWMERVKIPTKPTKKKNEEITATTTTAKGMKKITRWQNTRIHTHTHTSKNQMLFHLLVGFLVLVSFFFLFWSTIQYMFMFMHTTRQHILVYIYTVWGIYVCIYRLNFNVKWRATKYNGNLSKFHYDIPLHDVIRVESLLLLLFFSSFSTFCFDNFVS